jgi:hypothetical protein
MAVPLLSLVMPRAQAGALMLPIPCFIDLFGLRAFKGNYDRRNMSTAPRAAHSVTARQRETLTRIARTDELIRQ